MRVNLALLKFVAIILLVIAAILFFAQVRTDVDMGLVALGLAAWAASDYK